MEDKEIIKALEYCTKQGITSECEKCKVKNNGCRHELMLNALDLINRQKAEIEGLKDFVADRKTCAFCKHKDKKPYQKPCRLCKGYDLYEQPITEKELKAEAVKEFAERLKEEYKTHIICGYKVINGSIDNLLKETVGDADA